jgi:hypothetical protein
VRRGVLTLLLVSALAAAAATAQTPPQPSGDEPDPSIRDGSAQHALDRARARWRRARIHSYRFRLSRICFCAGEREWVLFVRDDRPLDPPDVLERVATVRRLHGTVQRAIDRGAAGLSVTYGSRGVPRRIAIDEHRFVSDDEITYEVSRFWRGTKGRGGPER